MPPQIVTPAQTANRRISALIVEGGAMRGAWAAGVLAYLHERGGCHYDLVYAASSGACSAAYFVAGLWEPALAIWRGHACKAVRKANLLRRKPIIDLAYLVDHIFRSHVPLSVEALRQSASRFFIVLTDCHTGQPVYFHGCDERVFAALRATASMPLGTRGYDYVDGHPYADGGVSDPIPIRRALQDGATDITVVLTHKLDMRLRQKPQWLGRIAYPQFPAVARTWTTGQHLAYNAALDLIHKPPPGLKLLVFRPLKAVPVGALTTAQRRIDAALASGHAEALEQIAEVVLPAGPVASPESSRNRP